MELTIRNISKSYLNGVQALQDINLTIGLGSCVLLGSTGQINSMLLRLPVALLEPDQGQLMFDDIDVVAQVARLTHFLLDTLF